MNLNQTYHILNSEDAKRMLRVYNLLSDVITDPDIKDKIHNILQRSAQPFTLKQLLDGSNPSGIIDDVNIFGYLAQIKKERKLGSKYLDAFNTLESGLRRIYEETELKCVHDPFQQEIMRKVDYRRLYGGPVKMAPIADFGKLPGCP